MDNTASGQTFDFDTVTDFVGQSHIVDGRVQAIWASGVIWNSICGNSSGGSGQSDVTYAEPVIEWDCVMQNAAASPSFALTASLPTNLSVPASGLTTTGGMPQIRVYAKDGTFVSSSLATAVSPSGTAATFAYPKTSTGGALSQGMYGVNIWNQTSPGTFVDKSDSFFGIGGATTLAGAFGTDAADVKVDTWSCTPGTGGTRCQDVPKTSSLTTPTPMFTQYYANQVTYNGHTFPVGSEPVAIKSYGTARVINPNTPTYTVTTTQPARAIVANLGSANINILDVAHGTVLVTISVGTQPIAVTVNSAGTLAYVANYGSGTVSEINLTSLAVSRTVTVGSGPESVAIDPGGSAIWVGGNGYLKKVDLTTFSVTATQTVSGSVTSLAASNAQNELVYTLVQNCCTVASTYATKELLLSNMTTTGTYASSTASNYATYSMNGTLPLAATLPQATTISAKFSNGLGASATPTGFVIYDLVNHNQIMSGTTPTPVRGISSNPSNTMAYFSVPDSNEYITVPLPQ